MSVEAIFFDLDGTLIDSLAGIQYSVDEALARSSLGRIACDVTSLIGPPIRTILQNVTGSVPEADLDRLEKAFRRSYDSEGWKKTACQPGVPEVLSRLREDGIRCFVVTNKPLAAARKILHLLQLDSLVEEIAAPDSESPAFQFKQDMLGWLMRRHRLELERCLMVGDTREDLEAARARGMKAAIVSFGYGGGDVAFNSQDCLRLEHFRDLLSFSLIAR